jgi:hypothetical protein
MCLDGLDTRSADEEQEVATCGADYNVRAGASDC